MNKKIGINFISFARSIISKSRMKLVTLESKTLHSAICENADDTTNATAANACR